MRKLFCLVTILTLFCRTVVYAEVIRPLYIEADRVSVTLLIDTDGTATCRGTVAAKHINTTTHLTLSLLCSSGKEFCNCSAQPGKSNYEDAVDILPSRYRLVLDPSGPLATGCNGSGSFSVFDTILGK